jgi:hypothetical protein
VAMLVERCEVAQGFEQVHRERGHAAPGRPKPREPPRGAANEVSVGAK